MSAPGVDLVAENAGLRTRLERERRTRLEAEALAERGTRELYERKQELELLHQIAESANAARSAEACLAVVLERWCRYTTWPIGRACIFAGEGSDVRACSDLWHAEAAEKNHDLRLALAAAPGAGLAGAVRSSGRSTWLEGAALAEVLPGAIGGPALPVHAAFAFPIRIGSDVVAVAEFFSPQPQPGNPAWPGLVAQIDTLVGRVFERLRARSELERAHQQLLAASRQAGMAEVATAVLHNVGNVLNSVNVSAALILEQLQQSGIPRLSQVVGLLREHRHDLRTFLTEDARGRLLPDFIAAVSEQLAAEQAALAREAIGLQQNVDHIKQIVAVQQSYATVSGTEENLVMADLVEDALRMSAASLSRHAVEVVREFAPVPAVLADRHKVLQILVNLVRNARQALDARETGRRLALRIAATDGGVQVEVADNGMGIAPENLARIFNHGFTTKKDGHGFGLHSGANAAHEMGGRLTGRSDGPGYGATFTLVLPLHPAVAIRAA